MVAVTNELFFRIVVYCVVVGGLTAMAFMFIRKQ